MRVQATDPGRTLTVQGYKLIPRALPEYSFEIVLGRCVESNVICVEQVGFQKEARRRLQGVILAFKQKVKGDPIVFLKFLLKLGALTLKSI
jgi:hypothetical protein